MSGVGIIIGFPGRRAVCRQGGIARIWRRVAEYVKALFLSGAGPHGDTSGLFPPIHAPARAQ